MKKLRLNQTGLVSIVSVMLIILIITVITLSLSSLTRRSLRQALDEQLSTQAMYAAESGVNDAIKAINSDPALSLPSCDVGRAGTGFANNKLSDSNNVRYTCVLVDQTPSELVTEVNTKNPKQFLLETDSGLINSLTFTWQSTSAGKGPAPDCIISDDTGCFKPSSGWSKNEVNSMGLLRVRLIPYAASLNRDTFASSKIIDMVAYPGKITNYVDAWGPALKHDSNCTGTTCSVKLDGLYAVGNALKPGKYYVILSSYYDDIKVTVTGTNINNSAAKFKGAQASIDSTGAAQDVVRRIRVTIPKASTSVLPNFTLGVGDNLCKRFTTNATVTAEDRSDQNACPSFD